MAWLLAAQPNWNPSRGHPPDRTLLDHPRDGAVEPLFEQNTRHERGDAEAQIDRLALAQLQGGPPGDHLFQAPFGQFKVGGRHPHFPADGRVVVGLGGLSGVGHDDDCVHEHAGHAHGLGGQAAGGDAARNLGDDDAATVVRGQRHIVGAQERSFPFECEIARLVGGRGPDQRHVRVQGAQVEPFLPVEFNQLHKLGAGARVHASTLPSRIEEGVHAHLREDAGTFGRGLA